MCVSNWQLKMLLWVLFLPVFGAGLLLRKEMKPAGALRLQITEKGLNYGKEVLMEMLLSELRKDPIQGQGSTFDVATVGKVSFCVSNIRATQLQAKDSALRFVRGRGIRLGLRNARLAFGGDWGIRHLLGRDNGTVQINIDRLSLSVLLELAVDDGGRPVVRCLSCSSNVADIDIKFSGRNSCAYHFAFRNIKRTLISILNEEVCTVVSESVNRLAQNLRIAKFWTQIDSTAGIDFSLVSQPEIAVDRCDLELKGEFFSVGRRQRNPLLPAPFTLPNRTDSMVAIGISDFLINSAAFVYFTENRLRATYTDKSIPKSVLFRLNTQYVGLLLPELKRQFPGMPIEVQLAARKEPRLHFHPKGLDGIVLGQAEAFVVLPNNSRVPVFTLNVDCNFTGQVFMEAVPSGDSLAKVGGSVALKGLRLSKKSSRIGEIQVASLESLLKIASHAALSVLNRKLRAGTHLASVANASLVNPKISMHQGYMLIETDLHLPLPCSPQKGGHGVGGGGGRRERETPELQRPRRP